MDTSENALKIEPATTYGAIVGSVLERERNARKLTQDDIAKAVGIGVSTWSRIEKGESSLSVEQLKAAADELGLAPSEILDKAEIATAFVSQSGIRILASGMVGSTVGSFIPVVGTVLGGIIGAVIGVGAASLEKNLSKSVSNKSDKR